MKPVFCGNLDYDTRQSELERLFSKYGSIMRIDMKSGYAFIYFDDERDAEDAIRGLDQMPFGYNRRRLSVEWSKQGERGPRGRDIPPPNTKPTRTLFVINFDPMRTRERDIERHFEPYGRIVNLRIRRNFAFVQYETLEEAAKALDNTHMSKLFDRVLTVEYAFRDDDEKVERFESPRRGDYGRRAEYSPYGRSPSPRYRRDRPSPEYRYARSPVYERYQEPAYDRPRSPKYAPDRFRSRSPVRRTRP